MDRVQAIDGSFSGGSPAHQQAGGPTVDSTLHRLERKGSIRRVIRGIDDRLQFSELVCLGTGRAFATNRPLLQSRLVSARLRRSGSLKGRAPLQSLACAVRKEAFPASFPGRRLRSAHQRFELGAKCERTSESKKPRMEQLDNSEPFQKGRVARRSFRPAREIEKLSSRTLRAVRSCPHRN